LVKLFSDERKLLFYWADNRFVTALEGVDIDNPGIELDRSGDRAIKITVPGPFTMSRQTQNEFYKDEQEMVLNYAAAVNAEIKDLFAAGADIVQIDEPYMQARPDKARQYGLRGLDAALDGVTGTTAIHICFGYAAIIHVRPSGYSFLAELATSPVKQISIETAQRPPRAGLEVSSKSGLSLTGRSPNQIEFSPFKMNHSERTCPGALCF